MGNGTRGYTLFLGQPKMAFFAPALQYRVDFLLYNFNSFGQTFFAQSAGGFDTSIFVISAHSTFLGVFSPTTCISRERP